MNEQDSSCSKKLTKATRMVYRRLFCIPSTQPSLWFRLTHTNAPGCGGAPPLPPPRVSVRSGPGLSQGCKTAPSNQTASGGAMSRSCSWTCAAAVLLTDIFYKPFASVWRETTHFHSHHREKQTKTKTNEKGGVGGRKKERKKKKAQNERRVTRRNTSAVTPSGWSWCWHLQG